MHTHQAISWLASLINDSSLVEYAQILDHSFSRNRKISLQNLLHFLIFRNYSVISEELTSFFGSINHFDIPTRQAMMKRMNILNYDVWDHIMEGFRNEIYNSISTDTLKDYIVIAVDGSFLDLPPHIALNHYFGGHRTRKISIEGIKKPQAKVSMIYDVLNRFIIDFSIGHYRTSEIPMLFDHLNKLQSFFKDRKVIILADRYYGSAELFKYCQMHGYKYIVRAKKNFFKDSIAEHDDEDDFDIHIELNKPWIKRIKNDEVREFISKDPNMDVRVVKGQYTYIQGKKEITVDAQYFTNLDRDELNTEEIIDIYHYDRWEIESAYDVLKNELDIEQFNTHNPIGIINEVMGKVIFYNLEKLIYMDAKKKIKQNLGNKYEYIPNNKYLIELLHHVDFIKEFMKGIKKKTLSQITEASSKERIPIRKGRHYKRWKKFLGSIPQTRHRIDGRRNPPVVMTKAGILTTNH